MPKKIITSRLNDLLPSSVVFDDEKAKWCEWMVGGCFYPIHSASVVSLPWWWNGRLLEAFLKSRDVAPAHNGCNTKLLIQKRILICIPSLLMELNLWQFKLFMLTQITSLIFLSDPFYSERTECYRMKWVLKYNSPPIAPYKGNVQNF